MSLREWFRRRGGTAHPEGRPVVLFPDTFNNYLHTNVGVACVEAIEAAGWRVIMPEQQLLEQMGLSVDSVSGGCCGLAGSWGFEAGKYQLSVDCGEQALLPAVRDASPDTLVVADGFSCKTQIADAGTGRRALHTAEVMALARRRGRSGGLPGSMSRNGRPAPPVSRRAIRIGLSVLPVAMAAVAAAALASRWRWRPARR